MPKRTGNIFRISRRHLNPSAITHESGPTSSHSPTVYDATARIEGMTDKRCVCPSIGYAFDRSPEPGTLTMDTKSPLKFRARGVISEHGPAVVTRTADQEKKYR